MDGTYSLTGYNYEDFLQKTAVNCMNKFKLNRKQKQINVINPKGNLEYFIIDKIKKYKAFCFDRIKIFFTNIIFQISLTVYNIY